MAVAIVRRLLMSIAVVFGSVSLVFFIMRVLPGDPVQVMLGGATVDEQTLENIRRQLGFDRPLYEQYFSYLGDLLRGDLGRSSVSREEVADIISAQFPATLTLTLASVLVSVMIGVLLGVISAIHRNRLTDLMIRVISLFGISMPSFWTAMLLILVFSVHLKWFPAMGGGTFRHLVLPTLALGIIGAGYITRMVRNSMLEVIGEPYILTLRAKGLSERIVMYKHALRNALIPAITMIGLQVGELLAGAVIIETVFARQGLGRVIVDAIMAKDMYVVQGAVVFTGIIYVTVNLLVDLTYSLIDPRVRKHA
jgi:peptide/nickel transport system permease protein